MHIDVLELENAPNRKNHHAIVVQDDGVGMNRRSLLGMLSFGFSNKEHVAGNVGRFGIGFKSGSMRLAKDALILTKREGQAHAAFLSQSFLDDAQLDDILIPMFTWRYERDSTTNKMVYVASEPTDTKKWDEHMAVVLKYSFVQSEASLLKQLDKIPGGHGTRIVLFNLREPPEFDFSGFKDDIRLVGMIPEEGDDVRESRGPVFQQTREGQQASLDVPEDYSLRAYMEILYLRPRVTFTLRGKVVVPRDPIEAMAREYYVFPEYRPRGADAGIIIHCGYPADDGTKKCGFHIYNKNRLIRLYQRFGSQLQVNTMMKDMIGVIEADSLEPTHNKQAFKEADVSYQKFKRHVVQCMNDYYFGIQRLRLAGGGGRGSSTSRGVTTKDRQVIMRRKMLAKKRARQAGEEVPSETESDDEYEAIQRGRGRPRGAGRGRMVTPQVRIRSIHRVLMTHKSAHIFLKPVDPVYWEIPDYFDVIKNPMDLGTIQQRIESGYYEDNWNAYAADVRLVWSNAMTYNKEDDVVYKMARIMSREFEYQWSTRFEDVDFGNIESRAEKSSDSEEEPRDQESHETTRNARPRKSRYDDEDAEDLDETTAEEVDKDERIMALKAAPEGAKLLVNRVAAVSDISKEKRRADSPMRLVRVPNALTTLMDESFFKTLEESFGQLEKELAAERAMNTRFIDENLKRGISGSSVVSVEELRTFSEELERLRERVALHENMLEVERAKNRKLEERIEKYREQELSNRHRNRSSGHGSKGKKRRTLNENSAALEMEKLLDFLERNYSQDFGDLREAGWRVEIFERKGGIHAGSFYNEFISPTGHKLRSMKEVATYLLNAKQSEVNAEEPSKEPVAAPPVPERLPSPMEIAEDIPSSKQIKDESVEMEPSS